MFNPVESFQVFHMMYIFILCIYVRSIILHFRWLNSEQLQGYTVWFYDSQITLASSTELENKSYIQYMPSCRKPDYRHTSLVFFGRSSLDYVPYISDTVCIVGIDNENLSMTYISGVKCTNVLPSVSNNTAAELDADLFIFLTLSTEQGEQV